MNATCPECDGPVMPQHPAGWLAIKHRVECSVLTAEDATRAADHERFMPQRPATPTEKALLEHLGYAPPDYLVTQVVALGGGYGRRWPQLETT